MPAPIAEDKRRLWNGLSINCEFIVSWQRTLLDTAMTLAERYQYRNAIAHYRRGDPELAYKLMNGLCDDARRPILS